MINRLINLDIKMPSATQLIKSNGAYTIPEYVTVFLEGLDKNQKDRFKKMLQNGIKSGMSVADSYGINYDEFINEVKSQLTIN